MHNFLNVLNKISFWAAPVFYKLLFMSLTAALAGIAILLIEKLWDRKISPLWKYLMWSVMLVALLVPFRPQSDFSVVERIEQVQDISYRDEYDDVSYELFISQQQPNLRPEEEQQIQEMVHQEKQLYWKSLIFDVLLPLLWLFGMLTFLLFFIGSRIHFMWKLQKGRHPSKKYTQIMQQCQEEMDIHRDIPIIVQDVVASPALTGVFYPKILLPTYIADMNQNVLRFVILHELGHYKRKDLWLNELLLILQSVYWFNPVIGYLFQKMRADLELLNDSFVLKKIGTEQSTEYARSLVAVLGYSQNITLVPKMLCMAQGKKYVERRIGMIKCKEEFKKHRITVAVTAVGLIIVIAALFLTTGKDSTKQEKLVEEMLMQVFTLPDDNIIKAQKAMEEGNPVPDKDHPNIAVVPPEVQKQLEDAIAVHIGDYFETEYAKHQTTIQGSLFPYITYVDYTVVPKEVSLEGENGQYKYILKVLCSDETEKNVEKEFVGRVQFNDKNKITFISVDSIKEEIRSTEQIEEAGCATGTGIEELGFTISEQENEQIAQHINQPGFVNLFTRSYPPQAHQLWKPLQLKGKANMICASVKFADAVDVAEVDLMLLYAIKKKDVGTEPLIRLEAENYLANDLAPYLFAETDECYIYDLYAFNREHNANTMIRQQMDYFITQEGAQGIDGTNIADYAGWLIEARKYLEANKEILLN